MEKFIVSARKYRPATFASVVGQQHITSTFVNAIKRNQLAHAYIFCGPRGVGKTTCARIIAKTINCMNPTSNNEACDKCESCMAFNKNASFNIHELDAASNNSVEDIRDLSRQVLTPPQVGKYSIYIIDEVHMLSSSAFNAFLKTLEEPPEYAIFILATTEKHKILPTILSRCQIYDFKRIKVGDVVDYLQMISAKEDVTYDKQSLTLIAQKADGCMRDALSMYDKVVSYCNSKLSIKKVAEALNILDYETYFDFVKAIYSGDYQKTLLMFDSVLQKGFDVGKIIEGLNKHLRDMLVSQSDKTISLLELPDEVAQQFKKNAKNLESEFIFNAMSLLTTCQEGLRNSLNQRLLCELVLLKLCNLKGQCFASIPENKASLPIIINRVGDDEVIAPKSIAVPKKNVAEEVVVEKKAVEAVVEKKESKRAVAPKARVVESPKSAKHSILGIPLLNHIADEKKSSADEKKKSEDNSFAEGEPIKKELLSDACLAFVDTIKDKKKRLAIALSESTYEDGMIKISVDNKTLEEDLNKYKANILKGILSKGNLSGSIDFEVKLCKSTKKKIAIFTSDGERLEHLIKKNPKMGKLVKSLDLEFQYK
ncbi:MAG: DNA polymerase III subunit gamma/tau [Bacteroidetes bacterium]|nr:DNA polymerase III subunit gamma/tau [Bacteroidota bacterium]